MMRLTKISNIEAHAIFVAPKNLTSEDISLQDCQKAMKKIMQPLEGGVNISNTGSLGLFRDVKLRITVIQ